jgi:hypothetical protein
MSGLKWTTDKLSNVFRRNNSSVSKYSNRDNARYVTHKTVQTAKIDGSDETIQLTC